MAKFVPDTLSALETNIQIMVARGVEEGIRLGIAEALRVIEKQLEKEFNGNTGPDIRSNGGDAGSD